MAVFLLDTNHLSRALWPVSPLRDQFRAKYANGHALGTCWPFLCELEAGIIQVKRPERSRRILEVLLQEIRIWPFAWNIVREFGRVHSRAKSKGRSLSHVDLFLIAMAIERGATILTTDKDFSAFPEIRIENWI